MEDGRGVDCFVGVGVRRDIVKETMGRGQVVLSGEWGWIDVRRVGRRR
jgi:hypothetical protein